jgi:hypothetical protein
VSGGALISQFCIALYRQLVCVLGMDKNALQRPLFRQHSIKRGSKLMITKLIVLSVLLTSSLAFADNMKFKVCTKDRFGDKKLDTTITINDSALNVHYDSPKGNSDEAYTIVTADKRKMSDYKDTLDLLLKLADVKSFDDALELEVKKVTDDGKRAPQFLILNYGRQQNALLIVVEGWPLPAGKTENCK